MNFSILFIRGTPGSGKSSLGRRLKKIFDQGVLIEVDNVRGMMNNVNWVEEKEHLVSLDVVAVTAKSFMESGKSPVIIVDMFLKDKLGYFMKKFPGTSFKVISLLANEGVLKKRLGERKEGFKNIENAISINASIKENPFANEFVIDTGNLSKIQVSDLAMNFLV